MALHDELLGVAIITVPLLQRLEEPLYPLEELDRKSIAATNGLVAEGKDLTFVKGKDSWRRVNSILLKYFLRLLRKIELVEDCHFRVQLANQCICLRKFLTVLAIFL